MTAGEAVERLDSLHPNPFPLSEKLRWLRSLDALAAEETGAPPPEAAYTAKTVLPIPEPHTELYLHWLQSRVLYFLGEYARYQNAAAQFNRSYLAYTAALIRTNAPAPARGIRF